MVQRSHDRQTWHCMYRAVAAALLTEPRLEVLLCVQHLAPVNHRVKLILINHDS